MYVKNDPEKPAERIEVKSTEMLDNLKDRCETKNISGKVFTKPSFALKFYLGLR